MIRNKTLAKKAAKLISGDPKRSSFTDLCDDFLTRCAASQEGDNSPPPNFSKALKKDLRNMRAELLGDSDSSI
jgi:hypothetical protein